MVFFWLDSREFEIKDMNLVSAFKIEQKSDQRNFRF